LSLTTLLINHLFALLKSRDNKLIKNIALKLIYCRNQKNYTQEHVYLQTGINIGRLERGKIDIGVTTLKRICDFYQIKLADFLKNIE